jgi:hypothetical protein
VRKTSRPRSGTCGFAGSRSSRLRIGQTKVPEAPGECP